MRMGPVWYSAGKIENWRFDVVTAFFMASLYTFHSSHYHGIFRSNPSLPTRSPIATRPEYT